MSPQVFEGVVWVKEIPRLWVHEMYNLCESFYYLYIEIWTIGTWILSLKCMKPWEIYHIFMALEVPRAWVILHFTVVCLVTRLFSGSEAGVAPWAPDKPQ